MIHTTVVARYTPFYTQPLDITCLCSPRNHFVPDLVRPLACSSMVVPHTLLFFFSNYQLAPLTNATPALSTLQFWCGSVILLYSGCLVLLGFNATLTAKIISLRSLTHMCFLVFSCQYKYNFFSKATDYFSHMFQQR